MLQYNSVGIYFETNGNINNTTVRGLTNTTDETEN